MADLNEPLHHYDDVDEKFRVLRPRFTDPSQNVAEFKALEEDMDATFEKFVKDSHNGTLMERDSSLLLKRAVMLRERVTNQVKSTNHELTVESFFENFKDFRDGRNLELDQFVHKLGRVVISRSRQAFGWARDPIHVPVVQEIKARRRYIQPQGQTLRPEEISEEDVGGTGNAVKKLAEFMYAKIDEHQEATNGEPIDIFRVVMHSTDFGQTVENVYALSLLVSSRKVTMYRDEGEKGPPLIRPTQGNEHKTRDRQQFIFTLNHAQWQQLAAKYHGEPFMPSRETR